MTKFLFMMFLVISQKALATAVKPDEPHLDPAYFAALGGNVERALELIHRIDPKILNPTEARRRTQFLKRFEQDKPPAEPSDTDLLAKVRSFYEDYWYQVLTQRQSSSVAEITLFQKLAGLLHTDGASIGEVTSRLSEELQKRGYYSRFGRVQPYLNFMAWKKQFVKHFTVNLGTGEVQPVQVFMKADFDVLGWAAYATLDKYYVGGWADEESLHCVAPSYDLQSENFRVSFLAHEARHMADLRRSPKMSSLQLEYRAKLTELLLAKSTQQRLLRKFILERNPDPANPHGAASDLLLKHLATSAGFEISLENFPSLPRKKVKKWARELLQSKNDDR